jgi:hypothetical protein
VAGLATRTLAGLLASEEGIAKALSGIKLRENVEIPALDETRLFLENVSREVAERAQTFRYPAVYIYCDRVRNLLREKFRSFSGTARLNIEVRVSGERLQGLEQQLGLYLDAITEVLHQSQGDWGNGVFYGGGYEIQFEAAKPGGRSYTQSGRVVLDVDVSLG